MNRFLLNISYIGTNFRGIQKTVNNLEEFSADRHTIQGCIELALQKLKPRNVIKTHLSSRTDAGVHALHSTLHVDLKRHNGEPYDEETITKVLNRTLDREKLPIRVLRTQLVPNTFHCRHDCKGRTYIYRLAVSKEGQSTENLGKKYFCNFIPIEELDRCYFMQDHKFDIERFRNASHMFLGRHDFRTFMNTNPGSSASNNNPMFTVRRINEINITPSKSLATGANATEADRLYNYWDIEITAKSFIYKQIRRMVGTLIALATGRIDEKCLYEMLTIPSKNSWPSTIILSPAYGLYLSKVHYNAKDFEFNS